MIIVAGENVADLIPVPVPGSVPGSSPNQLLKLALGGGPATAAVAAARLGAHVSFAALRFVVTAAALACTRTGAYAPSLAEVNAALV